MASVTPPTCERKAAWLPQGDSSPMRSSTVTQSEPKRLGTFVASSPIVTVPDTLPGVQDSARAAPAASSVIKLTAARQVDA